MSQLNKTVRSAAFILLLSFIFYYPVIFQGKTFYAFDTLLTYLPWSSMAGEFRSHNPLITDPVNAFYPAQSLFHASLESKRLCFWNPLNFCGVPTNPPPNPLTVLLHLLFSHTTAHDLFLWISLIGAGLFTYFYLKKIGLSHLPSLIGGVAWMFNGYVLVWFEFENVPTLAHSLPAILLFLECWLKSRRNFHFFLLSSAVAYAVSSHYAHVLIYQALFVGIYFVYRYIQLRVKARDYRLVRMQNLWFLLPALFSVLCISAPFLYSHIALLGDDNQQRPAYTFQELYRQTGQVHGRYLTTLIYPDFFGSPARNNSFTPHTAPQPYNNYNELCIYSGIVSLFLIIPAAFSWKRRKHSLFFLLTAISTLTMSMGSFLYYPLARFIPGLNLSTPTRIVYLFGFSICILAAIGADVLFRNNHGKKAAILTGWLILSAIAGGIFLLAQTEPVIKIVAESMPWMAWHDAKSYLEQHFSITSPIVREPLSLIGISLISMITVLYGRRESSRRLFLFLALVILSYDLMAFGRIYNTVSPKDLAFPETPAIRFLKKQPTPFRVATFGPFMHNGLAPLGIEEIGGYNSFYPQRYGQYLYLSQKGREAGMPTHFSRWTSFDRFDSPLLDLINTKYLLVPPSVSLKKSDLELSYKGEINIYENKGAFARIFFVPSAQVYPDKQSAYKALGEYTREDFTQKVILESKPPAEFLQPISATLKSAPKVDITTYETDKIVLDISYDQNGFLVISDNYHPGWKAEVDGVSKEIFRANYIMRAVPVPAGRHRIALTFYTHLELTFIAELAGWLLLWILTVVTFWKKW